MYHYIATGVTWLKWLQLRRHPTCSLIPPAEYGNLEPPDRARGVGGGRFENRMKIGGKDLGLEAPVVGQ